MTSPESIGKAIEDFYTWQRRARRNWRIGAACIFGLIALAAVTFVRGETTRESGSETAQETRQLKRNDREIEELQDRLDRNQRAFAAAFAELLQRLDDLGIDTTGINPAKGADDASRTTSDDGAAPGPAPADPGAPDGGNGGPGPGGVGQPPPPPTDSPEPPGPTPPVDPPAPPPSPPTPSSPSLGGLGIQTPLDPTICSLPIRLCAP